MSSNNRTSGSISGRSETAPGGNLLNRANPLPGGANNAAVFRDDCFELVLDPLRHDVARRRLYHVIVNAKGAMTTTAYKLDGGGEGWRGGWQTRSRIAGDCWEFEASVPLADLGVTKADLEQPMGVRICRNWMRTAEGWSQSEWGPLGGPYLTPATMPLIVWDAAAPVTQVTQIKTNGAMHVRLSVSNPTAAPLALEVRLRSEPKRSAHSETLAQPTLAPGETAWFELKGPAFPDELITTRIEVGAPGGKIFYYLRDFRWSIARPEPFFLINADEGKALGIEYAYYPSHNRLKLAVNLGALAEKSKVRAVRLALRAKGSATPVAETTMPEIREDATALLWQIPPLQAGVYEVAVSLDGLPVKPEVVEFVRHTFDWEKNQHGLSDRLVPPFTPIKVEGRRVSTSLREHTLNELCLPEQVVALGRPLFKTPPSLLAKIGGQSVAVTGRDFNVEQATATRAVMRSRWNAGAISGTARVEWDYDGMMLWTLELDPSATPLEALTLDLPLADEGMPLMHACTDGLRFNYAGRVPAGQGRVWDGSKAARNSIIGSYVPYIWVGAEERGFCVFGDNDRGWVTSTNTPCQELIREAGVLRLRLNLVAAPVGLDAPRRIVVGFQATPVKPMPDNWRRWGLVESYKVSARHQASLTQIAFMGACLYWGAEGDACDIYPRGGDLSFWDKLAESRRTGKVDEDYLAGWLTGYTNILKATASDERASREQSLQTHAKTGFSLAARTPQGVLMDVYTNPRGVRLDTPEGQTFLNEWLIDAYPARRFNYGAGVAYNADPTPSFRDYLAWYYRKMLTTFVDSIYWDNIFMVSSFNTLDTDAYELKPGVIQPSSVLSNMRALIRRTAVLVTELGRPSRNIAHMTNTGIIPILSFAQINFSWEDKVGALDFQDRYSRDYIRAESIGRQFGNVPIVLWLVRGPDQAKNAWADRTGAGVCLTHEIRPKGGSAYWPAYNQLLDFGYGEPGVDVSTYWQERHPARVEGSDAVSLVLHKPGGALVVVSDWGQGGDLALVLDQAALGFKGQTLKATDLESQTELTVDDAGRILFPLKKHDFKTILVRTGGMSAESLMGVVK